MGRQSGERPQRGLVLGAGGFLGAAWTLGALSALQESADWDVAGADLMIGTSAGSVLAMLLRSGLTVENLCAGQRGVSAAGPAALGTTLATAVPDAPVAPFCKLPDLDAEPSLPPLPRLGVGSVPLLLHAVRNPSRVRPAAWWAALVPQGRRRLTMIGDLVAGLHGTGDWPGGTHIVATDYWTGRRAVFGRSGSAPASPAEAVMASCAVPGWYQPVQVRQVPYVDGAVYSPCNADLARDCDEVYVMAPMASLRPDRPTSALGRLERWWRRGATTRTLAEARRLTAAGVRVRVLTPDAEELTVMGANMMDGSRRVDVMDAAREAVARRLTHPDGTTPAAEPNLVEAA